MPVNEVIVFDAENSVTIEQREVPEPAVEEVLIETERSLISTGTELAMLSGSHQPDNLPTDGFPLEPGYSNVGIVVSVGRDVDESLLGQRVVSSTEHAQYVVADVASVYPVPGDVSSVEASFFRIATIAMNAVRRGEISWGESVAVRGLGLIGQLSLQTAVVAGAEPVFGLDMNADRVALARDRSRVRPVQVADSSDESNERIADVVVDATGNPETLGGGVSLLREDGRFVVVGCPRRTVEFDFYRDCIVPSAKIIGSYRIPAGGQGQWGVQEYVELFFRYIQSDEFEVASLVTAEPAAETAQSVYESLQSDPQAELGVVFDWT